MHITQRNYNTMRVNEFTQPLFEGPSDGGNCYKSAANEVLKNSKYTLVHGVVTGQGPLKGMEYGHAWVEYQDEVMDRANDKNFQMPREVYYAIGNIDPNQQHKYNSEEVMEMIMKYETWGPWEEGVSPEVQ